MLSSEAITRGVSAADVLASILESVSGADGAAGSDAMITRRGWALVGSAVGLFVAGRILGLVQLAVLALVAAAHVGRRGRRGSGSSVPQLRARARAEGAAAGRRAGPRRHRRAGDARTAPTLAVNDAFDGGRRAARLLLAPLHAGEEARAAYRFPTDRRGRFEVGPLRVTVTDPFALVQRTRYVLGTEEVIVYPRVRDVLPPPEMGGLDLDREQPQVRSRIEPSGEFHTLREYAPGDDLRHVHWRSTARRGHLMMRQNEARRRTPVLVMLDVRPGSHDRASFERAVEACASIVTAIERSRPAGRGDAQHRPDDRRTRSPPPRHRDGRARRGRAARPRPHRRVGVPAPQRRARRDRRPRPGQRRGGARRARARRRPAHRRRVHARGREPRRCARAACAGR